MSNRNDRTRIDVTREEIEAIRILVWDSLRGEVTSKLKDEALGGAID